MPEETPKEKDPQASSKASADLLDDPSRRAFFKRVALGGGAALLAGGATYGVT